MVQNLNKSQVLEGKPPEPKPAENADPPWWDKYEKIEYRDKTYVFAFADVTPRLKKAQLATFVTLVKGLGRILTPVVVCEIDGVVIVIDGINRLQAAVELRYDIPFDVREGLSREEMRSLAVALNYHRRHLDQAGREGQIKNELTNNPIRSNNAIAADLGVSHVTVGKYRRELEDSGQIVKTETRTDRNGHERSSKPQLRRNTRKDAEPDTGSPATGSTTDEKPAPVPDEATEETSPENSQPTTQEESQPASKDQKSTAEQTKPAPAKSGLKTAVLDADGCMNAVRSAVTRIVTLLGTESVREAERASISKFADNLDELARKLRDALTMAEPDKGTPGVGG